MHEPINRRAILGAGLLAPFVLPRIARAQPAERSVAGEHHRIDPERGQAHQHGGAGATGPIERALAQPVRKLSGFDPARFLVSFEWGKTSTLPGGRTLREYTITAEDRTLEIAPGITFPAWTYNGSVPGPTLRCIEGDRLRIHFKNKSLGEHGMHFHGIHPAAMDGVTAIAPGKDFVYEFDAEPAGLHLYHCHTPPVDLHMSRGLYGTFIVDERAQKRRRATEMVLVAAAWDVDFDKHNEIHAYNGPANYYRDNPIQIKVGEIVRLYLVNMLEFDPINSFHLHGNFFTVYRGTPRGEVEEYTDIVTLCQAERRIIELSFKHPGVYMFHAHQNAFAERGGMGHFEVIQ